MTIRIRGAGENNLRGVDLDLPLGRWIAVTGPSGSGKTSLVFNTLVRTGERRFLGSLSPRARHFFGKLGRSQVDRIEGLPATIAIGERATTPHSRSTAGTLTGALDLLRLAFARCATHTSDTPLTRSHFSFNHPAGQCQACAGQGVEDQVDPAKLIADPYKSIRDGALVPTLKNGYTVYSQVTLEVMNDIAAAHGFDVDTPWQMLTPEQQHVIMFGTRALKVPFGKHSIESRMKWEGITARPREEGYYRGLIPVIEETLLRNRNPNILRFVSSIKCSACQGTRLDPVGREATLGDWTLPALLALPASELAQTLATLPGSPAWNAAHAPLAKRIERLCRLGLGHISLDRSSTTLSGGEAQRIRLAAQLGAELSGVLYALDEPTLGLHPESQSGMAEVLDELLDCGNHLIVVEHDPDMVRRADHIVAMGPGAGTEGGQVVCPNDLAEDPLGQAPAPKLEPREGSGKLTLSGASLHNLKSANLDLLLGALNVVMGPSGAGKSSLIFGTLLPALLSEPGGPFELLEFEERLEAGQLPRTHAAIQAVDARPIGKTPRSTPATWCGLFDLIRKRFAATEAAHTAGFNASHFSFNTGKGRCQTCEGLGTTRIGLHLFEDVELTCDTCRGSRYTAPILAVDLQGKSIADVLAMSFLQAHDFFSSDPDLQRITAAMLQLGLDYLTLGQTSSSLSRGESQRIKLGTLLATKKQERSVVLLDEPDRGLSPPDVSALIKALDALAEVGHTVIAISHHRHMWAAADRLIEVRNGETNHAPTIDAAPITRRRPARSPTAPRPIQLRGVSTHNLRNLDVDFPKGKLTAVAGVSGSGKSSLVFDTLAASASARFAESLPFQVRRFMRRLPAPDLASATGLTPTINLRQAPADGQTSPRSTLATLTEIGPLLRLIFSRAGTTNGQPCNLTAAHFSRERALGACPACSGLGFQERCDPARLITLPDHPLASLSPKFPTAASATRPGRYFTEHDGQHMAALSAALQANGHAPDLACTPWQELAPPAQTIALQGTGDTQYQVVWNFASDVEGDGNHNFEGPWPGLLALVETESKRRARSKKAAEWSSPLGPVACQTCAGSGLQPGPSATEVAGQTLAQIEALPLAQVLKALTPDSKNPVLAKLLPELSERLGELLALGLGHLSLARRSASLSQGELQRARLASVLRADLSQITLVLDEPAAGLHERDVQALLDRLQRFQAAGNTTVLVTHRASILAAADQIIELGPGAGTAGGEIITGPWQPPTPKPSPNASNQANTPRIRIQGARANNLQSIDLQLPAQGFCCITGVSGSGKTSLAFEVIKASLAAGSPINCTAFEGPATFKSIHDSRTRTSPRQTALDVLDIAAEVAELFQGSGLPARAFKPSDAKGRCPACKGTGNEHVPMDFLADLNLACQTCAGTRFKPEVLAATFNGLNIAEVLSQPASDLLVALAPGEHPKLRAALESLDQIAAAHIPLGRPRAQLSGGESNRLSLAAALLEPNAPAAYFFDEPARGLHERDLEKLHACFRKLADQGNLIVATEHRLSTIAAADFVIDLGPEGGPLGGQLVESGAPSELHMGHTAAALNARL